ncbi:MAG: GNAT family N-acetyltransferase [Dehalococcoidia bacterium]|nr:GNAT family N-acetyltransferase [Dehalococcoidia bacterium]
MRLEELTPPDLTVREATSEDNSSLIALELQSPLLVGHVEETFDRSPDFFACHRVQGDYRIVLGELAGRAVGVMACVIHEPLIQGRPHRLAYIQQARVHQDFHGRGVAWAMANDLFRWAGERGAEGPYYLISPENERSLAFVERGGGRWPADVTLLELDVSKASGGRAERIPAERLAEAVGLVNTIHEGEDFFEPLTLESLTARLNRDGRYSIDNFHGKFEGEALVAVGGLWDKGATTEQIHVDPTTGVTTRSRWAAVVDWGWASGRREAFSELLRCLAAEARALGRSTLMFCEPSPDAIPDTGLPARRSTVSLFTPAMQPPPAASIRGLFADMLYV